jgi:hypothetical protein
MEVFEKLHFCDSDWLKWSCAPKHGIETNTRTSPLSIHPFPFPSSAGHRQIYISKQQHLMQHLHTNNPNNHHFLLFLRPNLKHSFLLFL